VFICGLSELMKKKNPTKRTSKTKNGTRKNPDQEVGNMRPMRMDEEEDWEDDDSEDDEEWDEEEGE